MNYFKTFSCLGLLLLSAITAKELRAENQIIVKVPASNQVVTASVPKQTSKSTPVVFYYVSRGKISSVLGIAVQGPKGLEASVEASQLKGDALSALNKNNFWKVYLKGSLVETKNNRSVVQTRSYVAPSNLGFTQSVNSPTFAARSAGALGICDILPPSAIQRYIDELKAVQGITVSYNDFCSGNIPAPNSGSRPVAQRPGGNSGTEVELPNGFPGSTASKPSIDVSFGSAVGFVQKDSCASITNYLIKVTVKLDKVSAQDLSQGFDIQARLQEATYNGSRAASLKPVSDGKYAPRPLLLMSSLGGGQWINLVKWSGGKPKILTKVAASPSIVYYRGFILVRVVADKLLSGGRGELTNFELTNGDSIYNVCGRRARVRWRLNGYPG